jgi:hypothetical protein
VRNATGRPWAESLTLSALAGQAQAHAAARAQGATWEAEDWPEDKPDDIRSGYAGVHGGDMVGGRPEVPHPYPEVVGHGAAHPPRGRAAGRTRSPGQRARPPSAT